jgi:hypothetical protein
MGIFMTEIGNYVQHHQDCDVFDKLKRTCTCGLSDILAALAATPAVGGEAERLAQADADYQRKRYGAPPKPISEMDFETRDELLRKANYLLTFIAKPASTLRDTWVETAFLNMCEALGLQATQFAYFDAVAARAAIIAASPYAPGKENP